MRGHSSTNTHQQQSAVNKNDELLTIIHDELIKPVGSIVNQHPSISTNHVAVQCSPDDFNQTTIHSYPILTGRLSSRSIESTVSSTIKLRSGYFDRGIQVNLNENNIQSLSQLIELYSNRLSPEIVQQFYDLCNSDIQWTRTQLDEYLQHNPVVSTIPTLQQLSLNALQQWNEQLTQSNPSFDTISIGDILQDIKDEKVFGELILDNETESNLITFTDLNQIKIPWPIVKSLETSYGDLSMQSLSSHSTDGLSIPLDDDLSLNIYQALQRFSGVTNQIPKSMNEQKQIRGKKKEKKQKLNLPSQNDLTVDSDKKINVPSLKQIMEEELNYINASQSVPKRQLDFATQHKLKKLEQQFPNFSSDVLYEMLCNNEYDYELTLVCISSMLDEKLPIQITPESQRSSSSNLGSTLNTKVITETLPVPNEISRSKAQLHALRRKEYYNKADQANRHGMIGVASYYINQAREQTQLMKDANRIACEYLSKMRLDRFRQTHRLDLHELYADEALNLFKQVEQELSEGNRRTTPKSIEIITGYGKNSPYGGGHGKIRSVILGYLRQKRYKYSEHNKGAILVQF